MAIEYTWTIAQCEHEVATGGITVAHWRCTAEDGDYTASSYGTVGLTFDPADPDFTPYEEVTEAQAQALVWGEIKVTSAQHGYSAGDVIKVSSMLELDETDFVMTFWGNASQMGLRANNPDIHRWVAHKTSNTSTDYTFSDGNIEFYLVGVWF